MCMKKLILLIALCCIANLSNAQITVIPTIGMSCAFSEYAEKSQPGFNVGAIIDLPLSQKSWSFQTGLCYNNLKVNEYGRFIRIIGGKSITFDDGRASKYNLLEVPVNLTKRIDFSEDANLYFVGGAYLSVYLSGEELLRTKGSSDYVLAHAYIDDVHLGFTLGAGVEINNVLVGLDININATNYYPLGFHLKLKTGYRF